MEQWIIYAWKDETCIPDKLIHDSKIQLQKEQSKLIKYEISAPGIKIYNIIKCVCVQINLVSVWTDATGRLCPAVLLRMRPTRR